MSTQVYLYYRRDRRPQDSVVYSNLRGRDVRVWTDEHRAWLCWEPRVYTEDALLAAVMPFEEAYRWVERLRPLGPESGIAFEA